MVSSLLITPAEQRLVAPVYASVVILAQYPGPLTSRRYAQVPGVGLFSWSLNDARTPNGVDIIGHTGGASGVWALVPQSMAVADSVRVVAIDAITLSGEQTIDGEAIVDGDRVLVTAQTSAVLNGLYTARTGAWERVVDYPDGSTMRLGTSVRVLEGSDPGSEWYLSSPTSGTVVIGTSSLVFTLASSVGSDVARAYESTLDLSSTNYSQNFAGDGSGPCIIGLPEGPFVPGISVVTLIPANTATLLIAANNLDPNSDWDAHVPAKDYVVTVVVVSTTKVLSAGKVIEAYDTVAPTVSAVVEQSNLDRLILTFSEPTQFEIDSGSPTGSVAGLSLGGTMAIARTVGSVFSGNGTSEVTLSLSGNLDPSDTATFVVASGRRARELDGTRLAVGSTAITINAGVYDYSSMPSLTMFLDPALNNGSLADGAACASWTAQAGTASAVWTAAGSGQPTYRASKGGMPAMELDGVDDFFQTTETIDDLFNSTEVWFASAVWFDAIDTDNVPIYSNDPIMADSVGYWGVFAKSSGPTISHYAFDGSQETVGATIGTGGWKIVTARLTGGNLYIGVNGVESAPEAMDAGITTLTDTLRIGRSAGGVLTDGWVGKMITLAGNPGGTVWADAVASLVTEYGAV
jgi:hypothetical protein